MNLPLCERYILGLLFVFLFGGAARAADAPPIKPPGVRTKALEAKLAELKRRGLDYSDAVAFWPLGDGEGIVLRTFGTLGKTNPWLLATAAIDCEWLLRRVKATASRGTLAATRYVRGMAHRGSRP